MTTLLDPFRIYDASPCPTSSRRTISSPPPESETKEVTGGPAGLRFDVVLSREDLFARLLRWCCACMKRASNAMAIDTRNILLSILDITRWRRRHKQPRRIALSG